MRCLLLLLASHNFLGKTKTTVRYISYSSNNDIDLEGYDMTKLNETETTSSYETLSYIKKCMEKLSALNYLQNTKISIHDKIKYIENCSLPLDLVHTREIQTNVTAGGLFKDWDFDMMI
jgi:hypothetical protein